MAEKEYIVVLLESLRRKAKILDDIIAKNQEQEILILGEELDADAFEENIRAKEKLVEELTLLDQGFEITYDRVKMLLIERKSLFRHEIKEMQTWIQKITEKSAKVQVQEQGNYEKVQKHFLIMKGKIRQSKKSKNVTLNYYNSMNKLNVPEPQFMDKKK